MINFKSILFVGMFFLIQFQLSYAGYDDFTVNIPNAQGGYTAIAIKKSGNGYVGPQGEYYSDFPKVSQLQTIYGLKVSGSNNFHPQANTATNSQAINQLTGEEKRVVERLFRGDEPKTSLASTNEMINNGYSDTSNQKELYLTTGLQARGDYYRYGGNFEQAISDYNKSIETNLNPSFAYQDRGKAYYLEGNFGQAIADFTKSNELAPSTKDITGNIIADNSLTLSVNYELRGIAYYLEGEYALAIDDFNKALQIMPTYIYCVYFSGRSYEHLGNHDLAVNNYQKALYIEHQGNEQLIATNNQLNNPNGAEDGVNKDIESMVNSL